MTMQQFLKQKIVVNLIIPALLLAGWFGLIFYQAFQIEKVFTVLTSEYPKSAVAILPGGEIYQGNKIVGEFTATNNYLGILGFRFWTFYRLNDDYLIFRIREKKSLDWYYENRYKADQFQPNQYFTFGFPVIDNSKDRQYVFEIESSEGRPGIAVGVSEINPILIVKYKYPRQLVTSSATQLTQFSLTKLVNLLAKAEFKASTFIYLIPFLLYIISLTPAYYSFENKFKAFLRGRLKFISQLITETHIESDNAIDVTIKRIAQFILMRYRQTKTILDKFKLLMDTISTPFILSALFLISLFFQRPDIVSTVLMITGSILDSLFTKTGDLTIEILLILWTYLIYKYNLAAKFFFILALSFLGTSAVFYYFDFLMASERFGAWAWIFLAITVIMLIFNKDKDHPII